VANHKGFGTKRERDLVERLRADGWICTRTPASLGTMDIIALKAGEIPRFIQVKGTKKPFTGFSAFERYDLLREAQQAGARAELCWWPVYGKPEFIGPEDWPETIQPKALDKSPDLG
jgi:Holliday junction resolvase